jgi:hypothetical protein
MTVTHKELSGESFVIELPNYTIILMTIHGMPPHVRSHLALLRHREARSVTSP